jgi:hypothetical protein
VVVYYQWKSGLALKGGCRAEHASAQLVPVLSRVENVMFDDAAVWIGGFVLAFHIRTYPCDDPCGFGIRAWGRYGDFLEGLVDCKSMSLSFEPRGLSDTYLGKFRVNICQFESFFTSQSHVEDR